MCSAIVPTLPTSTNVHNVEMVKLNYFNCGIYITVKLQFIHSLLWSLLIYCIFCTVNLISIKKQTLKNNLNSFQKNIYKWNRRICWEYFSLLCFSWMILNTVSVLLLLPPCGTNIKHIKDLRTVNVFIVEMQVLLVLKL